MPILKSIETISQKLHLPLSGQEQDWAMEVADHTRIREFIQLYWQDSSLDQAQKLVIMALILASCEKALRAGKSIEVNDWKRIQNSLYTDPANHDLLLYWTLPGIEDVKQHFHLTPYLRSPA